MFGMYRQVHEDKIAWLVFGLALAFHRIASASGQVLIWERQSMAMDPATRWGASEAGSLAR
jgi:hypothetical protein